MKKGEYAVHWSGKVCRIEDITKMNLTGTKRMYLVLTPVRDSAEKIYVPEEKAPEVLRPVMSKEKAEELLQHLNEVEALPIRDEKQRLQEYKDAFYSQNYMNFVRIAKDLYERKTQREKIGKELPSRDKQMMQLVEKTFEEELAIALGVSPEQVRDRIAEYQARS